MNSPVNKLADLEELCSQAEVWTEGGHPVAFLPGLQIEVGNARVQRDVLLWPSERDGYQTRLFLSAPITAPQANNWNQFSLFGRTWHACSWQGVPAHLPWIEILANHLRAFR